MLNSTVWRRQHNLSINSETEHLGTLSDNTLVYWTREKGVITGNAAEYIWCRRASLLASRRGVESHRNAILPLENVLNSRLCHDVMGAGEGCPYDISCSW